VARFGTHSGVAGDYTLGMPQDWVFVERTTPAATGINVELVTTPPIPLPVEEAVSEADQPVEAAIPAPAE